MSQKTRRMTRLIKLDLPYDRWPENHNKAVQIRKRWKRLTIAVRSAAFAAADERSTARAGRIRQHSRRSTRGRAPVRGNEGAV